MSAASAPSQSKASTKPATPIVFIVDDDISVRESLELLIRSQSWQAETFESAKEFLERRRVIVPSCLVLDVSLPGLNGLDLQKRVAVERTEMPIIFIAGHGNVPMSVEAMKAGAVEFLTKPYREQELLEAIQRAIDQDGITRQRSAELHALQERYALLTPREREVFPRVTSGLLNKQIAAELGASEKTIKVHRGQVMQKMEAESLADLIRMAEKLGLPSN